MLMFTVYLSLKEKTVFQKYANPISFILKNFPTLVISRITYSYTNKSRQTQSEREKGAAGMGFLITDQFS